MARFAMSATHALGREEALRRVKARLDVVRAKYKGQVSDLDDAWDANTLRFRFKTLGFKLAGTLVVDDSEIRLVGELPFAAALFKGVITKGIRGELGNLLASERAA
jgi:putative polyhydroxyalkanoic acid system protein